MKIAYFGSPIFSAILLEQLILDKNLNAEITLVVTQPDKPVGKKRVLTPSPVKMIAQKYNIPVWDKKLNGDVDIFAHWGRQGVPSGDKNDNIGVKSILEQIDLAIVFAYGFKQLISLDLLKAPKIQFNIGEGKTSGFINIHPSLLPLYRGSSPIAYPILLNENKTGVTLFVMDEKMDHGPLITQEKIEIGLNDVRPTMEKKLTKMAFDMLTSWVKSNFVLSERSESKDPITNIAHIQLTPQNHSLATHAPFMTKESGFAPFSTLQKALKNEALTIQQLPQIVQNYINKYAANEVDVFFPTWDARKGGVPSGVKKDIDEMSVMFKKSSKLLYDFWRGVSPWPGIWTTVTVQNQPKRLKIIEMKYVKKGLLITKVQLEGKKEVDFSTFNKVYRIFS